MWKVPLLNSCFFFLVWQPSLSTVTAGRPEPKDTQHFFRPGNVSGSIGLVSTRSSWVMWITSTAKDHTFEGDYTPTLIWITKSPIGIFSKFMRFECAYIHITYIYIYTFFGEVELLGKLTSAMSPPMIGCSSLLSAERFNLGCLLQGGS